MLGKLAELEQMEVRQQAQSLIEPSIAVQTALGGMQRTFSGAHTKAKQALLQKLVAWVKLDKEQGEVVYYLPSPRDADLYTVPPGVLHKAPRNRVWTG